MEPNNKYPERSLNIKNSSKLIQVGGNIGLPNIGNSCWSNSFLQFLKKITGFYYEIMASTDEEPEMLTWLRQQPCYAYINMLKTSHILNTEFKNQSEKFNEENTLMIKNDIFYYIDKSGNKVEYPIDQSTEYMNTNRDTLSNYKTEWQNFATSFFRGTSVTDSKTNMELHPVFTRQQISDFLKYILKKIFTYIDKESTTEEETNIVYEYLYMFPLCVFDEELDIQQDVSEVFNRLEKLTSPNDTSADILGFGKYINGVVKLYKYVYDNKLANPFTYQIIGDPRDEKETFLSILTSEDNVQSDRSPIKTSVQKRIILKEKPHIKFETENMWEKDIPTYIQFPEYFIITFKRVNVNPENPNSIAKRIQNTTRMTINPIIQIQGQFYKRKGVILYSSSKSKSGHYFFASFDPPEYINDSQYESGLTSERKQIIKRACQEILYEKIPDGQETLDVNNDGNNDDDDDDTNNTNDNPNDNPNDDSNNTMSPAIKKAAAALGVGAVIASIVLPLTLGGTNTKKRKGKKGKRNKISKKSNRKQKKRTKNLRIKIRRRHRKTNKVKAR